MTHALAAATARPMSPQSMATDSVSPRNGPARILIVDDHPLIREGLTLRLSSQADLEICGEAATETEAMTLVKQLAPDLVLVDISLQSGNGIELIRQIKSRHPAVKTLVFSSYPESLYAERALRAGAAGYLNKQQPHDQLFAAVRAVLAGERYLSPEMTQRMVNQALGAGNELHTAFDRLTNRELEILRLIGEGLSTTAIANRLYLSPHTIETHRENLKRKLQMKDASELTREAIRWVLENG